MQLTVQATPKRWQLAHLSWGHALVELGLIVLIAWLATQSLHDFSDQVQLSGVDMVHLTRSADFAGQFLRSTGKIPLWEPFIGNGQPMLEAPQSFILNPFMSLPIMILGAKPGVLIVVLMHAVIMGWGGWAWARAMGFSSAGRLLMGGLLVSSGSVTGPLNHGVFQLALSQAYVLYVYAGLVALLFVQDQRWGLVLFVTATALLIFSGTFWYALPTAFGCAVIAGLALIYFRQGVPYFDRERFIRLLAAGLLVVGVSAIRLLTVNRDLLYHPTDSYDMQLSYLQVYINYFDPHYTFDDRQWFVVYHYVVPATMMVAVVGLALIMWGWIKHDVVGGWRIVVAGTLIVLVISFFGTGPTPDVNALYEAFPFIQDWRNPGRMAAAASPWIVVVVSWCFDRLACTAWQLFRQKTPVYWIGAIVLIALAVAGVSSIIQIANNWPKSIRLLSTQNWFTTQVEAARLLRELYPSQFIAVHTGWTEHFALNEYLIRHPHGDDDVFTVGVPPTIGGEHVEYWEEFAFGDSPDSGNGIWLRENGYIEMENVPRVEGIGALLDYNPDALAYAYSVPEQTLLDLGYSRLLREQTLPANYYHRIDQVVVEVNAIHSDQVLVIQETAYPGWNVTVDGQHHPIESVHRRLAVRLPAELEQATVIFTYQPSHLYAGALLTVISIFILIAYALRVDHLVRRRLDSRVHETAPEQTLELMPMIREHSAPHRIRISDNIIEEPEILESVYIETDETTTHVFLPPSKVPYHIEFVHPSKSEPANRPIKFAAGVLFLMQLLTLWNIQRGKNHKNQNNDG